jgi:hypothetical protein
LSHLDPKDHPGQGWQMNHTGPAFVQKVLLAHGYAIHVVNKTFIGMCHAHPLYK